MKKIIAAKTHTLLSLPNEELVVLANALNEVLYNSDVSAADCTSRIGMTIEELRRLHQEVGAVVDAAGSVRDLRSREGRILAPVESCFCSRRSS